MRPSSPCTRSVHARVRLDYCLFSQSSTLLRAASLVMPARS